MDFLDSVLESTRAKEAEVRKENAEQLELFRKQREAAEKAQFEEDGNPASSSGAAAYSPNQESWAARPKKRRRGNEVTPALGAKLRKTSSTELKEPDAAVAKETVSAKDVNMLSTASPSSTEQADMASDNPLQLPVTKQKPPPASTLGLGDYSSDDD